MLSADEIFCNLGNVSRQARMVQREGKLLCASAVPHVHADHVHAPQPSLGTSTDNVIRVARPFQSMHDDYGGNRVAICLPVAQADDLYALFNAEASAFSYG